jgi:hypothetical protein
MNITLGMTVIVPGPIPGSDSIGTVIVIEADKIKVQFADGSTGDYPINSVRVK